MKVKINENNILIELTRMACILYARKPFSTDPYPVMRESLLEAMQMLSLTGRALADVENIYKGDVSSFIADSLKNIR